MIYSNANLTQHLFTGMSNYSDYVKAHSLDKLLGVDLQNYGKVEQKQVQDPFYAVTPDMAEAFCVELDDLCRLHFLTMSRKVTTILEFGLGKSTVVFDDALAKNSVEFNDFAKNNLRRSNLFECHSVDNYENWIDEVKSNYKTSHVNFHLSKLQMGTFNDRVCTYYENVPNICPDLIYLDGPDQFSALGDIRGISTKHADRLPMAADILAMEHFLLPGTLIVTDGRTANARFLKSNLQRDWIYHHDVAWDQHYFELSEEPLGIYNHKQIEFCLGSAYFERLKMR